MPSSTTHLLDLEARPARDLHRPTTSSASIQFAEETDPEYRSASIDVYVDPAHHRRGYASDAIRTLVDHLFHQLGHHRLTIDPAADNAAAIACYTKVGFRPVGIMRQHERQADGTWADALLMDMLPSDRPLT